MRAYYLQVLRSAFAGAVLIVRGSSAGGDLPLQNARLTTNGNANGFSWTNVAAIVFMDGTVLNSTNGITVVVTNCWQDYQYPRAVLVDGTRPMTNALRWSGSFMDVYRTIDGINRIVFTNWANAVGTLTFADPSLEWDGSFMPAKLYCSDIDLSYGTCSNGTFSGDISPAYGSLDNCTAPYTVITNAPWLTSAPTFKWYQISYAANKEMLISSSSAGISATIVGASIALALPDGTIPPVYIGMRWPGSEGTTLTLSVGTNVWPSTSWLTRCRARADVNEELGGTRVANAAVKYDTGTFTQFQITGLNAGQNTLLITLGP